MYSFSEEFNRLSAFINLNPDPKSRSDALHQRGRIKFQHNVFLSAIDDFTKGIDLNRKNKNLYNDRGITFCEIGQHDIAVKDFDSALKLDKDFPEALFNRGKAKEKLPNQFTKTEIENDLLKVIELAPINSFLSESAKVVLQKLRNRDNYTDMEVDCSEQPATNEMQSFTR